MNRMDSSVILTDFDTSSIQEHLERDVEDAQRVDFNVFLEAVFDLSTDVIDQWSLFIRKQNWIKDSTILKGLRDFCEADNEEARYEPLAAIMNRVMELARGTLPVVSRSYPIDDICVRRNDPIYIQTIPEHGPLGALRKPDLVIIRAMYAQLLERLAGTQASAPGIKWSHSLMSVEVKLGKIPASRLDAVLQDRQPSGDGIELELVLGPLPRRRKRSSKDDIEDLLRESTRSGSGTTPPNVRGPSPKSPKVQMGSYALETLACTYGTRLFCVNMLIDNDRICLWYYDACGTVRTHNSISIVDDFEKAAALIVGIAISTPEHLGALPSFVTPPTSAPYPASWPTENLKGHTITLKHGSGEKEVAITLKKPIFTQYCLIGRRTFVYSVEPNHTIAEEDMIVKLSYQVETRKREQDLVKIARKAGVGHLPQIHLSGDLFKMSDGVRRIFHEKGDIEYEDRTLRMIVYSRYFPLQSLIPDHPEYVRDMAVQMIECLHDLKEKANILHRDVSVNNVMYELREGKPHFVLIDYDMAVLLPAQGERRTRQAKYREGTLPFMAIDLIENAAYPEHDPVPHLLRHDFESIFWLSVWCPSVLVEATDDEEKTIKENNIATVRAWETGAFKRIAHSKEVIRKRPLESKEIRLIGKAKCLSSWFLKWSILWNSVDSALSARAIGNAAARQRGLPLPAFNFETIQGLLTRDSILEALNSDSEAEDLQPEIPEDKQHALEQDPDSLTTLLAHIFPENSRRAARRTIVASTMQKQAKVIAQKTSKKAERPKPNSPSPAPSRPKSQTTRKRGGASQSSRTAASKATEDIVKPSTRRAATKTSVTRAKSTSKLSQTPLNTKKATDDHGSKKAGTQRSHKSTTMTTRKASSKKVEKMTRKPVPESPPGKRKRSSTPVKEAEVKAAAKRMAVKKAPTRVSSRIKAQRSEKAVTTTFRKETAATRRPRRQANTMTSTPSGTTQTDETASKDLVGDTRPGEMDDNDIRRRLRPRKRT